MVWTYIKINSLNQGVLFHDKLPKGMLMKPQPLSGVHRGPLAGIRVVDLSINIVGPLATQTMGDMGAEVLKIETRTGDPNRYMAEARHQGMAPMFLGVNRNKKSVVLDLKDPKGLKALMKLIETADVFVHSMRPSAADRLGIGYKAVSSIKPNIVYACGVGYRLDGPYGSRPAYDDVIQGESGMVDLNVKAIGEARYFPSVMADKISGLVLGSAIGMALVHKERTGEGQFVNVPMFETNIAFNLTEHIWAGSFEREGPWCYPRMLIKNRKPFPTKDGYVCILALTTEEWAKVWHAIGQPEMAVDPRFGSLESRTRNIDTLYGLLADAVAQLTTSDAIARLQAQGVAYGVVNSIEQLQDDPHLIATGFFKAYEHPTEGRVVTTEIPVQMSKTPGEIAFPPPNLGEHSASILSSVGYDQNEIERLSRTTPRNAVK